MKHLYRTRANYSGIESVVDLSICYVVISGEKAHVFADGPVSQGYHLTIEDCLIEDGDREIYNSIYDPELDNYNPYHEDIESVEAALAAFGVKLPDMIKTTIKFDTNLSIDDIDDHGVEEKAAKLLAELRKHDRQVPDVSDKSRYAECFRNAMAVQEVDVDELLSEFKTDV